MSNNQSLQLLTLHMYKKKESFEPHRKAFIILYGLYNIIL